MANKKQYDLNTIQTGRANADIEKSITRSGQQSAASLQEQEERKAKMKTQGRKGCKQTRVNMILKPDNHSYVSVMSKVLGMSMAEFVNMVISEHLKTHGDEYEQAQAIASSLQKKFEVMQEAAANDTDINNEDNL